MTSEQMALFALIGLGLTFLGVLVAIVGIPWYLGRKLTRVEHALALQGRTTNGLLALLGQLLQIMHKRQALSDNEFQQLIRSYTDMAQVPSHASPLTPDENQRLNSYLAKARNGDFFTAAEVEDYNSLVRKVEQEKKNDPSVWPLVALGAFLFGLFVASQKK